MASPSTINIDIQSNLVGTNTPLDLGKYITGIIGVTLTIAAVSALAYLILGGLSWITAGGDEKKVEEARSRITNAIVGLAVVAISWALFLLINSSFGIGIVGGGSTLPGGSTTSTTQTTSSANIHCPCGSGGSYAKTGAVSPGPTNNNCYICNANGWSEENPVLDCTGRTTTCYPAP